MDTSRSSPTPLSSTLRIFLLGGFRAEFATPQGYRPVIWDRPSAGRLIKLLAVEGRPLHREQIVDILWPDVAAEVAHNRLRRGVYLARHALEPHLIPRSSSAFLTETGDLIGLNLSSGEGGSVWVDADQFELHASDAIGSANTAALARALELYRGPVLPEDRYEDWPAARRERVEETHASLMVMNADQLSESGRFEEAVLALRPVVDADRTREEFVRKLMRVYLNLGSRHSALREYHRCSRALEADLEVQPEAETEELYREAIESGATIPQARPASEGWSLPPALRRSQPLPLIGREAIVDKVVGRLRTALSSTANRGQPGLTLVSGEAGVGKTRVLTAIAKLGHAEGWAVLWGSGHEVEGLVPYGALVEAFEGRLCQLSIDERRRIAAECPELTTLLPSLPLVEPAMSTVAANDLTRLLSSLIRLLDAVAHRGSYSLLLLVDDLHTADPSTLTVIQHLARLGQAHALTVIAGYRTGETTRGTPFRNFLDWARQQDATDHIDLSPLDTAHTRELVRALLPRGRMTDDLARETFRRSLGNPLFITQLIGDLQEQGVLELRDGEWRLGTDDLPVPRHVRDVVQARVDRLEAPTRHILELVSASGLGISLKDLATAISRGMGHPLTDGRLLDALDNALECGLLQETDIGYSFRHPMVRAAVYESLSRERRRQYHRDLGLTIERNRSADVDELAFHFEKAGNSAKAIPYLLASGDRARALYANEVAEAHYRRAVQLQADQHEPSTEALKKLAAVLTTTGKHGEALELLDRALFLCADGDEPEETVAVAAQLAQIHCAIGTAQKGIDLVQPVLNQHGDSVRPASRARLHLGLAGLFFAASSYQNQLTAADRAIEILETDVPAPERTSLLAEAQTRRGVALGLLGQVVAARDALERAVELAETAGNPAILHSALNSAASAHMAEGRLRDARTMRERAVAVVEQTGAPLSIAFARALLGHVMFLLGDWSAAREELERSVNTTAELDPAWNSAYPLILLGYLEVSEGRHDAGREHLTGGIAIAGRSGDLQALRFAHWVVAEQELWAGNAEEALHRLRPLVDREGLEEEQVTSLLPLVAWARFETAAIAEERTEALSMARRSVARARDQQDVLALADALRIEGRLLGLAGVTEQAHASVREAIRLSRGLACPQSEARALFERGTLFARQPATISNGRKYLERARTIFANLGAVDDVGRVRRSLAGLDLPVPTARRRASQLISKVTDEEWEKVKAVLPSFAKTGRPRIDDRRTLDGIRYVLQSGVRWQDMPNEYGSHVTAWRRYRFWQRTGVWDAVRTALGEASYDGSAALRDEREIMSN